MSVDLAKLDQALKAKGAGVQQAGSATPPSLSDYKCLIVRARGPGIQTPGSPAKNCNPQDWGLFTAPQENPLYNAGSAASPLTFTLQVNEGDNRKLELLGFNPYDNGSCASWSQRVLPGRFDTLIREVNVLAEAGPFSVFASQAVELTAAAPTAGAPSLCGPYLKVDPAEASFPRRIWSNGAMNVTHDIFCSNVDQEVFLELTGGGNNYTVSGLCVGSTQGGARATLTPAMSTLETLTPGLKNWHLRLGELTLPLPPLLVDKVAPTVSPSPSPLPTQLPGYDAGEGRGKIFKFTISDVHSPLRMSAGLTQRLLLTQPDGQAIVAPVPQCDLKLFPAPESDGPQQRRFSAFLGACKNPAALNAQYSFRVVEGLMRDGGDIEEGALQSPETELALVTLDPSFFSESAFAGQFPTNIQATANAGSATMSWTGVAGAMSYLVLYSRNAEMTEAVAVTPSMTVTGTGTATTITGSVSGLDNGVQYWFQVRSTFPASPPAVTLSAPSPAVGPRTPILPTFTYTQDGKTDELCFNSDGNIYPAAASTPSVSPSPLTSFNLSEIPASLSGGTVSITSASGSITVTPSLVPIYQQVLGVSGSYVNTTTFTNAQATKAIKISKAGFPLQSDLGTNFNFGTVAPGETLTQTLTFTNPIQNCRSVTPSFGIYADSASTTQAASSPFSIVTNCTTAILPNSPCTAELKFSPASGSTAGTTFTHYLKSTDPNGPATVPLTGTVGSAGQINVFASPATGQLTPSFLTPQLRFKVTATPQGVSPLPSLVINPSLVISPSFSENLTGCSVVTTTLSPNVCSSPGTCSIDITISGCQFSTGLDSGSVTIQIPNGFFKYGSEPNFTLSPAVSSTSITLIKPPTLKISQFDLRTRRVQVDLVPGSTLDPASPTAELWVAKNGADPLPLDPPANGGVNYYFDANLNEWNRAHRLKFELRYGQGGTVLCGPAGPPACPIAEISVPLPPPSTLVSSSSYDGVEGNLYSGHSCMIAGSGTASESIQCFGEAQSAQLGNSSYSDQFSPTQVTLPSLMSGRLSQISVGSNFSCALTQFGERLCWGDNSLGQLGLGLTSPSVVGSATLATDAHRYTLISAGRKHACGITYSGELYCWGYGLFRTTTTPAVEHIPVKMNFPEETPPLTNPRWVAVSAGGAHTCAILAQGDYNSMSNKTYCWGTNDKGQLGLGTVSTPSPLSASPLVRYNGNFLPLRQISAGSDHTCAIRTDHSVYCWGDRNFAQAGDLSGNLASSPIPLQFTGLTVSPVSISAGHRHTCASLSPNTAEGGSLPPSVHCWGKDYDVNQPAAPQTGVLGLGSSVALMHTGLTGFPNDSKVSLTHNAISFSGSTELAAGAFHTCAVGLNVTGQRLFCWGKNTSGQLGIGDSVQMSTLPVGHSKDLLSIPAIRPF